MYPFDDDKTGKDSATKDYINSAYEGALVGVGALLLSSAIQKLTRESTGFSGISFRNVLMVSGLSAGSGTLIEILQQKKMIPLKVKE